MLESYYPVGTSKFSIRAATETGWTRWSAQRVFDIETANAGYTEDREPVWNVDLDSNDQYPVLAPFLHIGHSHEADDTLMHLSLRHTFFA